MEPYNKKWIPSLKNSQLVNENIKITKDLFNETFISKDLIDRKKQIKFNNIKTTFYLDEEIKSYYTLLPKTISNKLKLWVKKNNNSTKEDFINKIYDRFSIRSDKNHYNRPLHDGKELSIQAPKNILGSHSFQ